MVFTNLMTVWVGFLTLVLLAIAAAGVFNATLRTTLERIREISGPQDGRHDVTADRADPGRVDAGALRPGVGVGVPLGNWLQGVIWDSMLSIFDVVIRPGASLAPLPLALALVAAFVFAGRGAALPARWAPATPVAQVLRSE